MVAWRFVVDKGDPYQTKNHFDCFSTCWRDNQWDDDARRARGCTRLDLPPVEWTEEDLEPMYLQHYFGRPPSMDLVRELGRKGASYDEPAEELADGCPAGWSATEFANSVVPKARVRLDGGGRVHLPMYERACAANPVMEQAIQYYEAEEDRHAAYQMRLIAEKTRREAEQRKKK